MRSNRVSADALAKTLDRQESVISRAQCLACGMTHHAIEHRIRPGGPWQRLLPAVYLAVTGTPTYPQKEVAALLYAGTGSVLTGVAALRRHGLRTQADTSVTVLAPAARPHPSRGFVKVMVTTRMPESVFYREPVQFALPARAVADATRELDSFREVRGLVAAAVQQRVCQVELLRAELEAGPTRHSAWLRRALAEVADGIRSGAEGDFRDLLIRAGLPMPMFNARLYAGGEFLAITDAWWPDAGVAAEVESREWHLSPGDWENTLARSARLSAHGILVLHFTPGQIRTQPAHVIAALKNALNAGGDTHVPAVRARPAA